MNIKVEVALCTDVICTRSKSSWSHLCAICIAGLYEGWHDGKWVKCSRAQQRRYKDLERFRVEAKCLYRTALTQAGTDPVNSRSRNRYRLTLSHFKLTRYVLRRGFLCSLRHDLKIFSVTLPRVLNKFNVTEFKMKESLCVVDGLGASRNYIGEKQK